MKVYFEGSSNTESINVFEALRNSESIKKLLLKEVKSILDPLLKDLFKPIEGALIVKFNIPLVKFKGIENQKQIKEIDMFLEEYNKEKDKEKEITWRQVEENEIEIIPKWEKHFKDMNLRIYKEIIIDFLEYLTKINKKHT